MTVILADISDALPLMAAATLMIILGTGLILGIVLLLWGRGRRR